MLRELIDQADASQARDDAVHCESITRTHARTFALASGFLPARRRRGAFAVYAFCRLADDIVDRAEGRDRSLVAEELARYRAGVAETIAGRPQGPVFRELWRTIQEFDVPASAFEELLRGVATDLEPTRYATWAELTAYCEGVASSVGTMCTYIFGVEGADGADRGAAVREQAVRERAVRERAVRERAVREQAVRERAVRYARTLGVAMQLTNILRDVGEDAARGRCYLPDADLATFGLTADRVLHDPTLKDDPRWAQLMRHEIARARALYRAASPGVALLAPESQRCARACADGYAAILGAIETNGYDSFTVRARVGNLARAGLLWTVWRSGAERPPLNAEGPTIEWGQRIVSRPEEMVLWA